MTEQRGESTIRALVAAREQLEAAYREHTPRSAECFLASCNVLPGGNTRSNLHFPPYPPVMASADASTLLDIDGNRYVDCINDYTVAAGGHRDPRIERAIADAAAHGWSWGARSDTEVLLAEAIRERFPSMQRLRFVNSGTEASLYALLLARISTGRERIIVMSGGYHGGVLSFLEPVPRLNVPFEVVQVPYNDTSALHQALDASKGQVAAVMMELMLNSGGCIPATAEFARSAATLAHAAGALFIVDEVMTARLGFHGLQGMLGLEPDLTVLGKIIGGGMPCGAFGGRADLMAWFDSTRPGALNHNGSFNNNVFTMRAGLAALTEVLTREVMEDMNRRGDRLRARLNDIVTRRSVPLVFSGAGSVMALHSGTRVPLRPVTDSRTDAIRHLLHMHLLRGGFWSARRGMLALSAANTDAQTDALAACVETFIDHYHNLLVAS